MKSKLIYWLTYAGMWLLALLPFRALYILSDGLYLLMRHVVHYRRGVVRILFRKSLKPNFVRLSVSFITTSAIICWKKSR